MMSVSLPLMGIENVVDHPAPALGQLLITPHGDWEPAPQGKITKKCMKSMDSVI